ncbi:MAG: AMP nucleosidase, partial [Paracoccaceae bacterium]|nr:AMP nucleosidase [Paracoccaceae bacterium]
MPARAKNLPIETPDMGKAVFFSDADAAVTQLQRLYEISTKFLQDKFKLAMETNGASIRYRAFYPEIRIRTQSFEVADSRLSFGHVSEPGEYATTVTRPDLFESYLKQQIGLLIANHGVDIKIGCSTT